MQTYERSNRVSLATSCERLWMDRSRGFVRGGRQKLYLLPKRSGQWQDYIDVFYSHACWIHRPSDMSSCGLIRLSRSRAQLPEGVISGSHARVPRVCSEVYPSNKV